MTSCWCLVQKSDRWPGRRETWKRYKFFISQVGLQGFGILNATEVYNLGLYLMSHNTYNISTIDPEIISAEVENKAALSRLRLDFRIALLNPANCNMDLAKPLSPELFNQMVSILNYMPVKFRRHILRNHYGWLEEESPAVAISSPPRPTGGAGSYLASPTTGAEQDSSLASPTTSPDSWFLAGAGSSPSRPTTAPLGASSYIFKPTAPPADEDSKLVKPTFSKLDLYIIQARKQRENWRAARENWRAEREKLLPEREKLRAERERFLAARENWRAELKNSH